MFRPASLKRLTRKWSWTSVCAIKQTPCSVFLKPSTSTRSLDSQRARSNPYRLKYNTYFDIIATIAADRRSEIPIQYLYQAIVGPIADPKIVQP